MMAEDSLIQLTRTETVFRGSPESLAAMRTTFDERHWLRLPQLVMPDLLKVIQDDLATCNFKTFVHQGIGKEVVAGPGPALSLLTFLVNDPRLFDVIGQITGRRDIQCFTGRVYSMSAGSDDYDSWHDDVEGHRLIAMSLNLATTPHRGGVLQIRDRASKRILQDVTNTTYGDAVIFRVAPQLQHRVTSVEDGVPRMAFAGWFRSQPSIRELLHGGIPDSNSKIEIDPA